MYRLIGACILGIALGLFLPNTISMDNAFTIIMPILLFSVGFSLGGFDFKNLFKESKRYVLFPIFSILGSSSLAILYSIVTGQNMIEIVLTGSAMGFYSLPAIMVSTQLGAVAGTLLLLTNILREAITIIFAPLIVRLFGKDSIIAVGGATTMDVSLAMIKEVSGDRYVPIAILNGLILTVGVPFIISFLLYLNFLIN